MTKNEQQLENNPTAMPNIDLGKIANMDALDSQDKKMVNSAFQENPRKANKRKFCFQEPKKFILPSKGKYYQDSPDEDLRNGFIKLYPMSIADEETLTNKAYQKNGSMLRILFDSCIASDYDAKNILQFDAMYIMYILRSISYGNTYNFEIDCPECNKKIEYEMDINDIDWNELPESEPDVREIALPISGFTVTMPLPRLYMDENLTRLQRQNEKNKFCTDVTATFVSRTISIKDPDGNELNPQDWFEFFATMPIADRNAINKSFENASNEPTTVISCPECGNSMETEVPISVSFFRP